MENSLRANPLDIHAQYEKQLRDLQEATALEHRSVDYVGELHQLMARIDNIDQAQETVLIIMHEDGA